MQSLYITHAHRVNNATPKAKFHNIIGICAMKNSHFTHQSEWQARALRSAAYVLLASTLCGPACARAKKSGRPGRVQTGLDVLEAQKFVPLRKKHIGLITNHTGLDSQGRSTVDLLTHVAGVQDRKSTRLNSSHQIISYAVFCLKKKKTNNKPGQ